MSWFPKYKRSQNAVPYVGAVNAKLLCPLLKSIYLVSSGFAWDGGQMQIPLPGITTNEISDCASHTALFLHVFGVCEDFSKAEIQVSPSCSPLAHGDLLLHSDL